MINVLVVDDSSFIRKTISSFLQQEPEIHVVGQAEDGQQAMSMVDELGPDVVIMDLNMPNVDGVTAIRRILKTRSIPILVFTSAGDRDCPRVLDALNAGAVDFISKEAGFNGQDRNKVLDKLKSRVLALNGKNTVLNHRPTAVAKPESVARDFADRSIHSGYEIVVIGASTGGPVVIENILKNLTAGFPLPILIVQHMPAEFTRAFAERLNTLCQIRVEEATDSTRIEPGTAYLAPGGRQMEIVKNGSGKLIRITDHQGAVNFKPCVDITFRSVATIYGRRTLAIVLTGMGSDGQKGAELLKQKGATVWAQDQKSSVVFGMPMAIINNNLADKILSGTDIGTRLAQVH